MESSGHAIDGGGPCPRVSIPSPVPENTRSITEVTCPRVMYTNLSLIDALQGVAVLDPFGTLRDAGSSRTASLKPATSSVSRVAAHSIYMLISVSSDPR